MIQKFIDEKLSGRKVNRWLTTAVIFGIGSALVVAAWRWAFGHPFPEIPAQALVVAALPYAQSMYDNWVRSQEQRNITNAEAARAGLVNPVAIS